MGRRGRRFQQEEAERVKKRTLFRGNGLDKLPIFDPHRPVTLPNLVRTLANIPLEKSSRKKEKKAAKAKLLSSKLAADGFKHFKGSYLAEDHHEDNWNSRAGVGREPSPPPTPRVRGRMLKMKQPDAAPPIPARGIMKLRCSKHDSLLLGDLGCTQVPNEMVSQDEKAKEWLKQNRTCDLFMKKVDPTIDEQAYSISEEAQMADSSSHMFGVHFRGALFIPNGSSWDGNKLLQVRTQARKRKNRHLKKLKLAKKEQKRRDRNEKFRMSL
eukprot:Stramenopile-MAST_4_protein_1150